MMVLNPNRPWNDAVPSLWRPMRRRLFAVSWSPISLPMSALFVQIASAQPSATASPINKAASALLRKLQGSVYSFLVATELD